MESRGFALVEVLIAAALLATALVGLAQLLGLAAMNTSGAGSSSIAAGLAAAKMEQLRSLSWGVRLDVPVSDATTDTTRAVLSTGGTGLTPSASNTLLRNVSGYVDYLDPSGLPLGGGPDPPPGAAYLRRWFIEAVPDDPDNLLVIHVLVRRVRDSGADGSRRLPGEARLTTVRTRKTQ